jgi:hypothetical protein
MPRRSNARSTAPQAVTTRRPFDPDGADILPRGRKNRALLAFCALHKANVFPEHAWSAFCGIDQKTRTPA